MRTQTRAGNVGRFPKFQIKAKAVTTNEAQTLCGAYDLRRRTYRRIFPIGYALALRGSFRSLNYAVHLHAALMKASNDRVAARRD